MVEQFWVGEERNITVCVDSYDNGVFRGRFYNACHNAGTFDSLSQFLVKTEALLEMIQSPQAYTTHRTFSALLRPVADAQHPPFFRRGVQATFELKILFRQHSSWQGMIKWKDRGTEQYFRSVLELVFLVDSALRDTEGSAVS